MEGVGKIQLEGVLYFLGLNYCIGHLRLASESITHYPITLIFIGNRDRADCYPLLLFALAIGPLAAAIRGNPAICGSKWGDLK